MRARLPLPALDVLDPGNASPDGVVHEGDLGCLLRIRCDARHQRVQVLVAGCAQVEGPDHLVTSQTRFL